MELKAIIPAAGYGTRLYPLTKDTPKALLDIAGKPVLSHVLDRIELLDEVDQVFIVTNDKFYNVFADWVDLYAQQLTMDVEVINDGTTTNENRLGAIGDKYLAIKKGKIKDNILDISSDNLFDFELGKALEVFNETEGSVIGLYDVKNINLARHYGIVAVDAENKLTAFQEKPKNPLSTLASIGIYMFQKDQVPLFKKYVDLGHAKDAPGYFVEWLHKKEPVYGHVFEGKWFDIGSFEQLDKAREDFKVKK